MDRVQRQQVFHAVAVEHETDGSRRSSEVGRWRRLWSSGLTIGSSRDCSVVIESDSVRPVHARVYGRGHHLVAEAIEGPLHIFGREVEIGRFSRINGLGPPVGPVGIGPFRVHIAVGSPSSIEAIAVVEPSSKATLRPWWKLW